MEFDAEEWRSAHNEESGRSGDSSAEDARREQETVGGAEEEESGPARSARELISKLENNEWEKDLPVRLSSLILPYLLLHVERLRQALQGNTLITEVCIEVPSYRFLEDVELSPEDFAILGQVFASLASLRKVTLWAWASRIGFRNLTAAVAFLRQTRQIQCFTLEVKGRHFLETQQGFDTEGYADALSYLPFLNFIEVRALSLAESRHITLVFPSLSNLRSVAFHSYDFTVDDEGLQQVLWLGTLRELSLGKCVLSERNVRKIGELLSYSGSHLHTLHLRTCQLRRKGCESLAASLKHNRSLTDLVLSSHVPSPDMFFHMLKDSLSVNTSLAFLTVKRDVSKKAANDLVEAIRGNYRLIMVVLVGPRSANGVDESQESMLMRFPLLNFAGRRYMIGEPASAEKGFHVLWRAKEDLDCLFLHLEENPLLCIEVLRRVADGKRKARDAIGQELEQPVSKKHRSI